MAAQILPISEISSYQTKWTIKARVTNKAPIRTFKRGNGEGKVFSVELVDALGGEIKASFFNDAADKYFNILEAKKCFKLSKGSAKIANKQYNNTNHRYELTFESGAIIEPVEEDAEIGEISSFKFLDIDAVSKKEVPCRVDLCGIVTAVKPISTVNTKDGRELTKRDITLVDDTASSMDVTLWGNFAKIEDAKFESNPVIGIKSVLVKEFNGGKSGSTLEMGGVFFDPKGAVADRVRKWWSEGGSTQTTMSISSTGGGGGRNRNAQQCNLTTMRQMSANAGEQPEFYSCVSRLAIVQTRKQGEPTPLYYRACAETNRKVDETGYCAFTGKNAAKVVKRFNIRCRFSDISDSVWLTSFHEAAEGVLAMKAENLEIDNAEGREKFEEQIKTRYFAEPLQLTVRAKLETYNGEPRANVSCVDARPVNRREHGRTLLKEIQQMIAA